MGSFMEPVFKTILRVQTAAEADYVVAKLRAHGFHPVEPSMSSHFSLAGAEVCFPIEVPTAEFCAAKRVLDSEV